MRRTLGTLLAALLLFAATAQAQRNCVRGKPCGNTCIAVNKTCRISSPAPRPAPAPAARPATDSASAPADSIAEARWVASSRRTGLLPTGMQRRAEALAGQPDLLQDRGGRPEGGLPPLNVEGVLGMRTLRALISALVLMAPLAVTASLPGCSEATGSCCRVCRDGKACGDSCIPKTSTCNVGPGCACNG